MITRENIRRRNSFHDSLVRIIPYLQTHSILSKEESELLEKVNVSLEELINLLGEEK